MTIHVYHPYRQPDGENYCQAVNGHCSHLCLPAPRVNERSPRISCACPTGLKLMDDGLMCVEDGKCYLKPLFCGHSQIVYIYPSHNRMHTKFATFTSRGVNEWVDWWMLFNRLWKLKNRPFAIISSRLLIHIYQILTFSLSLSLGKVSLFYSHWKQEKVFQLNFSLFLYVVLISTCIKKSRQC